MKDKLEIENYNESRPALITGKLYK